MTHRVKCVMFGPGSNTTDPNNTTNAMTSKSFFALLITELTEIRRRDGDAIGTRVVQINALTANGDIEVVFNLEMTGQDIPQRITFDRSTSRFSPPSYYHIDQI